MVCKSCGKAISDEGISFCPHCGTYLREIKAPNNIKVTVRTKAPNVEQVEFFSRKRTKKYTENSKRSKRSKRNKSDIIIYSIILCLWVVALFMLLKATGENYYFNDKNPGMTNNGTKPEPQYEINGNAVTSVVYNNKYLKQYSINSREDVLTLIRTDSNNQKNNCPADILLLENDIVNDFNITAANLCEMDIEFAKEIYSVIEYIYNTFPNARGYLTNITLANVTDGSYMAAFLPISTFVSNKGVSDYPKGYKSMVILNAKYFLDMARINNAVKYGVSSGYFPPNATRSSTVAHEFGHYLSFVTMMKYYHINQVNFVTKSNSSNIDKVRVDYSEDSYSFRIINEAYNMYKVSYGNNMSLDEFRSSISSYAVAKDNDGNYIYDETIAEAFHDCYLNNDNAKIASKLIMNVLKGYM